MAVNPNSYLQSPVRLQKPSRMAFESPFWNDGDMRRHLAATLVGGGRLVEQWVAPWPGVIEEVRTTQQVAAAGAGLQNSIALTVGGVNCFTLATDGNTLLDNVAAAASALTFPTANLTACGDLVNRVRFNMGDVIALTGVATAAYGTARTDIIIARELPADAV